MIDRKSEIFWELIEALSESKMLSHIMIIGSWAEYLYPIYFGKTYVPNLKTHDVDLLYRNPFLEVDGARFLQRELSNKGFVMYEGYSGTSFFKEGVEVEFLTSSFGKSSFATIPFTNITAEALKDLDMLEKMVISTRGYEISVPTPNSYAMHKLYINPERNPQSKRPKDIEAVRELLRFVKSNPDEWNNLRIYLEQMHEERLARIYEVARINSIDLPITY